MRIAAMLTGRRTVGRCEHCNRPILRKDAAEADAHGHFTEHASCREQLTRDPAELLADAERAAPREEWREIAWLAVTVLALILSCAGGALLLAAS